MSRALGISLSLLAAAIVAALCVGRYPIAPSALLTALGLGGGVPDPVASGVIWHERMPRVIGATLIGAALAGAGGSFQAMFRNPLVAPDLLGVLAGSGFGAALAILIGLPVPARMAMTFAGGAGAVGLALLVSRLFSGRGEASAMGPLLLVFGGLVSGALFTALLSIVKFVADPQNTLADIVFWLLGSLTQVDPATLWVIGPPMLLGILCLVGAGRALDLLILSDDEALSLGVPVHRLRLALIVVATGVSALTVTLAGTIGWVGLVIPHVARLLVGPAHGRMMPVCACLGAVFLLGADTMARTLTPSEIPIGIVTDLAGVLAFLAVLPRVRRSWQ